MIDRRRSTEKFLRLRARLQTGEEVELYFGMGYLFLFFFNFQGEKGVGKWDGLVTWHKGNSRRPEPTNPVEIGDQNIGENG